MPIKRDRKVQRIYDTDLRKERTKIERFFHKLNVLTGELFGQNTRRCRHQEFIRFLNALERDIPAGKFVHVILDGVRRAQA